TINLARERHGRKPLRISPARVASVPRRHNTRMARAGSLFHSCLSCLLRRFGWSRVGENVGFSPTVRTMARAFMRSPPHRENVLCRCFTRIAVGVVRSGGRLWVTELLYQDDRACVLEGNPTQPTARGIPCPEPRPDLHQQIHPLLDLAATERFLDALDHGRPLLLVLRVA